MYIYAFGCRRERQTNHRVVAIKIVAHELEFWFVRQWLAVLCVFRKCLRFACGTARRAHCFAQCIGRYGKGL